MFFFSSYDGGGGFNWGFFFPAKVGLGFFFLNTPPPPDINSSLPYSPFSRLFLSAYNSHPR